MKRKTSNSKFRQESEAAKPSDRLRREDTPPGASGTSGRIGPKSKDTRCVDKAKSRVEKTGSKLDISRDKLANQKPPKKPGVLKSVGHDLSVIVNPKAHSDSRFKHYGEWLGEDGNIKNFP